LTYLAQLPYGNWHHAIANVWILVATFIGVMLLLAPRGFPLRWLGIFWVLPLFCYSPPKPPMGAVTLTILDVGQGLAVVVRTHGHTLIYDTGPRSSLEFDAGNMVVIPYLQTQGIHQIDGMVISHGDADHSGGALSILKRFPSPFILTSVPIHSPIMAALGSSHIQHCSAGHTWTWDGVQFQSLHPQATDLYLKNNSSCVLQIQIGSHRVLLPGDIEKEVEALLVRTQPAALGADILIAAHHGSRTSSTTPFIQAVAPQYVVFASGYRNRFHHPAEVIERRYQKAGSILLNTAVTGAVTFEIAPYSPIKKPLLYGLANKRVWD